MTFKKTEAATVWLSGNTWNKVASDLNANTPSMVASLMRQQSQSVTVQNNTGADIPAFVVVAIGDPVVLPGAEPTDDAYQNYHCFNAEVTDADTVKMGIVNRPLLADAGNGVKEAGTAIVTGVATAVVNVLSIDHKYATTSSTAHELVSTDNPTSIAMLYTPGTGSQTCKVFLGNAPGAVKLVLGVANVDIQPGQSGSYRIWEGDPPADTGDDASAYLDWMHQDEQISEGKQILVAKMPDRDRIIGAECEDIPPQTGQVAAVNEIDATTGVWGAIPNATTSYDYSDAMTAEPTVFGFQVTQPGFYQTVFTFTAEAGVNNTLIGIRSNSQSGTSTPITWEVKSAPGSVGGTFSNIYEVRQTDLDAFGGFVYITMERNINNTITWINAELVMTKVGNSTPEASLPPPIPPP